MLKHFILTVVFSTVFAVSSFAQGDPNGSLAGADRHDIGIIGGLEFYKGDFTDGGSLFYKPNIQGGLLYRYNISRYLAVRAQVVYGSVEGSSGDYYGNLPGFPTGATLDFDRSTLMVDALLEFNFLPYSPNDERVKNYIAPYMVLGIGGSFLGENRINNNPNLNIAAAVFPELYGEPGNTFPQNIIFEVPVGFGIKVRPYKRLTLAAEFMMKKTFYDDIDGFTNKGFEAISLYNSDWISTVSLCLTYRITSNKTCNAYGKPFRPTGPLRGVSTYEMKKSKR